MIKNIKTIAEAKAKCLNQKDGKQKYVVVEQWLKMFKKWYSPSGNEYTATLPAVEIYSYIAGFNEQGQECYATQKTLSNIGMVSDRQVRNIINMFVDMGVLSVEARHGQTSLYKALPFTDAHITAPREAKASVNAEKPQTEQVSTVKAVPEQLPPTEDKKTLETTRSIQQEKTELPWGGVTICKPNGQPTEAALEWALAETQGDNIEAYRLISIMVSEFTGREHIYTIPETEEDDFDIPF